MIVPIDGRTEMKLRTCTGEERNGMEGGWMAFDGMGWEWMDRENR